METDSDTDTEPYNYDDEIRNLDVPLFNCAADGNYSDDEKREQSLDGPFQDRDAASPVLGLAIPQVPEGTQHSRNNGLTHATPEKNQLLNKNPSQRDFENMDLTQVVDSDVEKHKFQFTGDLTTTRLTRFVNDRQQNADFNNCTKSSCSGSKDEMALTQVLESDLHKRKESHHTSTSKDPTNNMEVQATHGNGVEINSWCSQNQAKSKFETLHCGIATELVDMEESQSLCAAAPSSPQRNELIHRLSPSRLGDGINCTQLTQEMGPMSLAFESTQEFQKELKKSLHSNETQLQAAKAINNIRLSRLSPNETQMTQKMDPMSLAFESTQEFQKELKKSLHSNEIQLQAGKAINSITPSRLSPNETQMTQEMDPMSLAFQSTQEFHKELTKSINQFQATGTMRTQGKATNIVTPSFSPPLSEDCLNGTQLTQEMGPLSLAFGSTQDFEKDLRKSSVIYSTQSQATSRMNTVAVPSFLKDGCFARFSQPHQVSRGIDTTMPSENENETQLDELLAPCEKAELSCDEGFGVGTKFQTLKNDITPRKDILPKEIQPTPSPCNESKGFLEETQVPVLSGTSPNIFDNETQFRHPSALSKSPRALLDPKKRCKAKMRVSFGVDSTQCSESQSMLETQTFLKINISDQYEPVRGGPHEMDVFDELTQIPSMAPSLDVSSVFLEETQMSGNSQNNVFLEETQISEPSGVKNIFAKETQFLHPGTLDQSSRAFLNHRKRSKTEMSVNDNTKCSESQSMRKTQLLFKINNKCDSVTLLPCERDVFDELTQRPSKVPSFDVSSVFLEQTQLPISAQDSDNKLFLEETQIPEPAGVENTSPNIFAKETQFLHPSALSKSPRAFLDPKKKCKARMRVSFGVDSTQCSESQSMRETQGVLPRERDVFDQLTQIPPKAPSLDVSRVFLEETQMLGNSQDKIVGDDIFDQLTQIPVKVPSLDVSSVFLEETQFLPNSLDTIARDCGNEGFSDPEATFCEEVTQVRVPYQKGVGDDLSDSKSTCVISNESQSLSNPAAPPKPMISQPLSSISESIFFECTQISPRASSFLEETQRPVAQQVPVIQVGMPNKNSASILRPFKAEKQTTEEMKSSLDSFFDEPFDYDALTQINSCKKGESTCNNAESSGIKNIVKSVACHSTRPEIPSSSSASTTHQSQDHSLIESDSDVDEFILSSDVCEDEFETQQYEFVESQSKLCDGGKTANLETFVENDADDLSNLSTPSLGTSSRRVSESEAPTQVRISNNCYDEPTQIRPSHVSAYVVEDSEAPTQIRPAPSHFLEFDEVTQVQPKDLVSLFNVTNSVQSSEPKVDLQLLELSDADSESLVRLHDDIDDDPEYHVATQSDNSFIASSPNSNMEATSASIACRDEQLVASAELLRRIVNETQDNDSSTDSDVEPMDAGAPKSERNHTAPVNLDISEDETEIPVATPRISRFRASSNSPIGSASSSETPPPEPRVSYVERRRKRNILPSACSVPDLVASRPKRARRATWKVQENAASSSFNRSNQSPSGSSGSRTPDLDDNVIATSSHTVPKVVLRRLVGNTRSSPQSSSRSSDFTATDSCSSSQSQTEVDDNVIPTACIMTRAQRRAQEENNLAPLRSLETGEEPRRSTRLRHTNVDAFSRLREARASRRGVRDDADVDSQEGSIRPRRLGARRAVDSDEDGSQFIRNNPRRRKKNVRVIRSDEEDSPSRVTPTRGRGRPRRHR